MLSRNLNICEGYDPFFAHHLILGRNSNICGRYDLFFLLIMCFWGTTDQRAQTNFLPRGPKVLSVPLTASGVATGRAGVEGYNPLLIEPQMTSYIIETVRTKCIIGEALKVRGQKYAKLSLKIVQKALKWPLQYANLGWAIPVANAASSCNQ